MGHATNERGAVADPLLTTDEAAQILRVSPGTLSNWRNLRDPARTISFVKVGGAVRYRRSAVERFIAASERDGDTGK
jgi:excisionase family DNA binding protein